LPSEMNAAYLWAQLKLAEEINNNRLSTWNMYYEGLKPLAEKGRIELPFIPDECEHNAHMFYIKCRDLKERTAFINFMKEHGISCTFHYVPLHSSPAGIKFGIFHGKDINTTKESDRLVRLPMFYNLNKTDTEKIIHTVNLFYAAL